jgi:hypothetical protein
MPNDIGPNELDLSGVWHGSFSYPRERPPTNFTAVLQDADGWLTGATEEVGEVGDARGRTLKATPQGKRSGREVLFLKTYDGAFKRYDSVRYAGELSAESDEISGVWTVPGSWSGNFVMIRSGHPYVAVERKAVERV